MSAPTTGGPTRLAEHLRAARILAILRRPDIHEVVAELTEQLVTGGVKAIEVTLDQPTSLDALVTLVDRAPDDVLVGAGTVMTVEQVDAAVDAGAAFLVCPHLDVELVERARARGVELIPGVTSGTEVARALAAGVSTLKLFPAGPLGTGYLRALRGPFRQAAFVPTGGIAAEQAGDWLEAGAVAVGLGSDLFGPEGVRDGVVRLLQATA